MTTTSNEVRLGEDAVLHKRHRGMTWRQNAWPSGAIHGVVRWPPKSTTGAEFVLDGRAGCLRPIEPPSPSGPMEVRPNA